MPDPRYPIGKFQYDGLLNDAQRAESIRIIRETPDNLRAAVTGLTDAQLDTRYRDGGWTVRQVAHHVPDSHMNAYIRTKLALTEDKPTIKPYSDAAWAELPDSRGPIAHSLMLLESVHTRWLDILSAMKSADFERQFIHPDFPDAPRTLDWLIAYYAWHGPHHVAHVTTLRKSNAW